MEAIQDRRVTSIFTTSVILILVGIFLFTALLNREYGLAVLCLIIFGISFIFRLWTRYSHRKIKVSSYLDRTKYFCGDNVSLGIVIENKKFLPVAVEAFFGNNKFMSEFLSENVPEFEDILLWHQRAVFNWKLIANKRGVHAIGPVRTKSGDLFGFFKKDTGPALTQQIIVFPKISDLKQFSLPRRDFFGAPGGKSPVDDPVYILGTSDYHYGRPAKRIHWKASARHFRLQEKIFESSHQEKVLIILDAEEFVQTQSEEAFESIIETAASAAVTISRQGCAVGFLSNCIMHDSDNQFIPVSAGTSQLSLILEAMARLKFETAGSIVNILKKGITIPSGTSCMFFSCTKNTSAQELIHHFKYRRLPIVFYSFEKANELRKDISVIKAPDFPEHEQDDI
ncbi:MAG: DUF58 domain-containing protein [Spirochaetes bacterium]|nr:DUF58 domain-containing protein [Spirochaetota bacterium]